jgi:LuxR family transcriptional regulator, maltose regulon positive regulatory protein
MASLAYVGLGRIDYEWNELEEAARRLREGLALAVRSGLVSGQWDAYLALAALEQARGDSAAADAMLERARPIARYWDNPLYRSQVEARQVRLWLRRGDVERAARWADSQALSPDGGAETGYEALSIALAYLLNAQGKYEHALRLIERLALATEQTGRASRRPELMLLAVRAQVGAADRDQALAKLAIALRLAEPEGWVRIFVDGGEPVRHLLVELRRRGPLASDYLDRLIAAFPPRLSSGSGDAPPEMLSLREREVLRLIAAGRTNRQIAAELVLALGTVKAHINNIYGKLGVNSRTRALARARELQLL